MTSIIKGGEVGTVTYSQNTKVTSLSGSCYRNCGLVTLNLTLQMNRTEGSNWITAGSVSFPPKETVRTIVVSDSAFNSATLLRVQLETSGAVRVFYGENASYRINISYPSV